MIPAIDTSPKLIRKAFHDIKNPLANLMLLTEINNFSKDNNKISPLLQTINTELWKVVAQLDMLQTLLYPSLKIETMKEVRLDECIDEAIASMYNIDPNFNIHLHLPNNIHTGQLLIAAHNPSLTRLFYFVIRQLYLADAKAQWYGFIASSSKGIEIFFSKTNISSTENTYQWKDSFENWEWLAAQKVAQQHNFILNTGYTDDSLTCIQLIR